MCDLAQRVSNPQSIDPSRPVSEASGRCACTTFRSPAWGPSFLCHSKNETPFMVHAWLAVFCISIYVTVGTHGRLLACLKCVSRGLWLGVGISQAFAKCMRNRPCIAGGPHPFTPVQSCFYSQRQLSIDRALSLFGWLFCCSLGSFSSSDALGCHLLGRVSVSAVCSMRLAEAFAQAADVRSQETNNALAATMEKLRQPLATLPGMTSYLVRMTSCLARMTSCLAGQLHLC